MEKGGEPEIETGTEEVPRRAFASSRGPTGYSRVGSPEAANSSANSFSKSLMNPSLDMSTVAWLEVWWLEGWKIGGSEVAEAERVVGEVVVEKKVDLKTQRFVGVGKINHWDAESLFYMFLRQKNVQT